MQKTLRDLQQEGFTPVKILSHVDEGYPEGAVQ